jgi:transcriptional regulator with XRE-family HTH domain
VTNQRNDPTASSSIHAERRFGNRLRSERERLGWTQRDLATRLRALGVDFHDSTIAKIETRTGPRPRAIRLDEAEAIAIVLGLDLSEMIRPERDDLAELIEDAKRIAAEHSKVLAQQADFAERLARIAEDRADLVEEYGADGAEAWELFEAVADVLSDHEARDDSGVQR